MRLVLKLSFLMLFLSVSASIASAQYVVSAKAGLVNYMERYRATASTVTHEDGTTDKLHISFQLENGDVVETHGRIEILLNPGSMLRLERGSTLKVVETRLSDMHFELQSGTALIEASSDVGQKKGILLQIKTSQASFNIEKAGVYEITTSSSGATIAKAHKGETLIQTADGKNLQLKGGHQLTIGGSTVAEAKIDKKSSSDFELWGQDRAETMAVLNDRIDIRDTLMGQPSMPFSGMWFYSGFYGGYLYMPFSNFYYSPYGFWYDAFYNPYYWGNRYGYVYTSGFVGGTGGGTVAGTGPVRTGGPGNTTGPTIHNPGGSRGGPTNGPARMTRTSPGPTHNSTYGGGGYAGGYNGGFGGGSGGSSIGSSGTGTSVTRSTPSSGGGS